MDPVLDHLEGALIPEPGEGPGVLQLIDQLEEVAQQIMIRYISRVNMFIMPIDQLMEVA
jgi:hypothetical protein